MPIEAREPLAQDLSTTLRVMNTTSVRSLLSKISRLARETAERLQKLVRVETSGESLEVPRDLVTTLSGPLVHLARNAVDHGLETDQERKATDKELIARIRLSVYWRREFLVVEVGDDGRGICPEKILSKAKERGIVASDAMLDSGQSLALLMEPGFSTAATTTELSGRGVGMDVVKREIEAAGGRVEIHSTVGEGSMFRVVLPKDPGLVIPTDLFDEPDAELAELASPEPEIELLSGGELNFL